MKRLLFICIILLTSCMKQSQTSTKIGEFNVEFLFEHDGIKVYRFQDNGRPIYFSNVNGMIKYNTGGKNNELIQTMTNNSDSL